MSTYHSTRLYQTPCSYTDETNELALITISHDPKINVVMELIVANP